MKIWFNRNKWLLVFIGAVAIIAGFVISGELRKSQKSADAINEKYRKIGLENKKLAQETELDLRLQIKKLRTKAQQMVRTPARYDAWRELDRFSREAKRLAQCVAPLKYGHPVKESAETMHRNLSAHLKVAEETAYQSMSVVSVAEEFEDTADEMEHALDSKT